jgi:hypothetical protein
LHHLDVHGPRTAGAFGRSNYGRMPSRRGHFGLRVPSVDFIAPFARLSPPPERRLCPGWFCPPYPTCHPACDCVRTVSFGAPLSMNLPFRSSRRQEACPEPVEGAQTSRANGVEVPTSPRLRGRSPRAMQPVSPAQVPPGAVSFWNGRGEGPALSPQRAERETVLSLFMVPIRVRMQVEALHEPPQISNVEFRRPDFALRTSHFDIPPVQGPNARANARGSNPRTFPP